MAAVELATGYISLAISTKGLGRSVAREFTGIERAAEQSGRRSGDRLSSGLFARVKAGSGGISAGLIGVTKVAGGAAAALGGVAAAGIGVGIKTAAGMEQAKIGFTTMLGSATKADKFLKQLASFAAKTPFEFPELQTAASSLISAGIEADKVIPIMTTLGDVTSGMGTGAEGVQRATIALQQMNAAGRITGEDLNQLRDAGIPVYDLLAKATGKSKAEIVKLAQAGKLGKKELDLMMKALETGKGLERFNGLMQEQSKSLTGMWSTLKDTFSQGLAKAIQPALPFLKSALGFVTNLAAKGFEKLPALFSKVGAFLKPAAVAVKSFFATLSTGMTEQDVATPLERLAFTVRGLLPVFQQVAAFITNTVVPAFVSWAQFMAANWLPIIRQIGAFFVANVLPAFKAIVNFIVTQFVPGFLSIVDTVKGLYAVLFPIISQIVGVILSKFQEMRPQIMSIWNSVKEIITGAMFIIREVIQAVTAIVGGIWARWGSQIMGVVKTVFGGVINIIAGVMKVISGIIKLFVALIKGDWKGAWNAVKQIFSGVWQAIKGILSVSTAVIGATLAAWWAKVKSLFAAGSTFIRGLWDRLWSGVKSTALAALNWVRDRVSTVLDKIKSAFSSARDSIKKIWDGLKDIVSKPVQWIIDHVYNKPLVPVWNRVAGLVGGPKLNAYARGGVEPYGVRPGYTPGRDTHVIRVGGGEAIMRPEFTRAVGADWVHRANKAARRGKARRFVQEGGIPGFAGGGVVGWLKGLASNVSGKVGGLAGKLKDWVLGGLRDAAAKVLSPIKNLIGQAMPNTGVGNTIGGIGKKAIDLVLEKIQSTDAAALAKVASQGAYTGPPGTGSRGLTTWHGGRFTQRFRNTLEQAQRIAGYINVIQGGFRPATSYSGTSHRGDAIDTSWKSSVLSGLRRSGVAAWHRTPAQGFAHHIHGVPLPGRGFPGGSGIWQAQDYLRGGNGLASGGIVKGGRGGLQTWIGEGRRDELVLPLPKGWDTDTLGQPRASLTIHGGVHGYSAEEIAAAIEKLRRRKEALQPSYV